MPFEKESPAPNKSKSEHDGHRKRMRKALLDNGAGQFDDIEILEMMLYYVLPRVDTKKYAESLINKFGSLEGVINAEKGEIASVSGLKDSAEAMFLLLREIVGRTGGKKFGPSLTEPERLKKYLIELYQNCSAETVYALYFSQDGCLVGTQLVFKGGISSARFALRTVTEGVIRAGGCSVVLAHNHPSGSLVPSNDDIISTKRIAAHLAANDIQLIDHYIVGKTDCIGILNID